MKWIIFLRSIRCIDTRDFGRSLTGSPNFIFEMAMIAGLGRRILMIFLEMSRDVNRAFYEGDDAL